VKIASGQFGAAAKKATGNRQLATCNSKSQTVQHVELLAKIANSKPTQ